MAKIIKASSIANFRTSAQRVNRRQNTMLPETSVKLSTKVFTRLPAGEAMGSADYKGVFEWKVRRGHTKMKKTSAIMISIS
jgi:hypothetical protein